MKKWIWLLLFILAFAIGGCSNANTPALSQMQIREITTKEVEADFKTTFKATMSILQDQEYIIENTDFNSGLIVAEKEENKKTTAGDVMMILFVDARHKRNGKVRITATINEINQKTSRIRLNIQEKHITKGTFNSGSEDIKNIQEKQIYDTLFSQILTEIERIKAMN